MKIYIIGLKIQIHAPSSSHTRALTHTRINAYMHASTHVHIRTVASSTVEMLVIEICMSLTLTFIMGHGQIKIYQRKGLMQLSICWKQQCLPYRWRDILSRNVYDRDLNIYSGPKLNVNMSIERLRATLSVSNNIVCPVCHVYALCTYELPNVLDQNNLTLKMQLIDDFT